MPCALKISTPPAATSAYSRASQASNRAAGRWLKNDDATTTSKRLLEDERLRLGARHDPPHAERLLLEPDGGGIDLGDRDLPGRERLDEEPRRTPVAAGEVQERPDAAEPLEPPRDHAGDGLEDLAARREVEQVRRLGRPVRRGQLEAVHLVRRMDPRRERHRAPASSAADTVYRPTLPTTETESARPSSTRRASASTSASVTASTFAISSSIFSVRRK